MFGAINPHDMIGCKCVPIIINAFVWLCLQSASGVRFVVHPNAFTVHAPHIRARTWKITHKTGLWDQVSIFLRTVVDVHYLGVIKGSLGGGKQFVSWKVQRLTKCSSAATGACSETSCHLAAAWGQVCMQ